TPDNYLTLYNEIAGIKATEVFPQHALKQVVAAMPASTTEQVRYGRLLENAVATGEWEALQEALQEIFERSGGDPLPWGAMLKDLLAQLEVRSATITQAKKRESLDHVLRASGSPETLFQRLQNVLRHWSRNAVP